jgi:hypothetical protein
MQKAIEDNRLPNRPVQYRLGEEEMWVDLKAVRLGICPSGLKPDSKKNIGQII